MAAAANQTVVTSTNNEECPVVNRWLVDHYISLAIQAFKDNEYETFCTIRDILDGVLSMPVEVTNVMNTKIRVMQFLSRINDGDQPGDVSFEADDTIVPLESAMELLKTMGTECNIEQQDLEPVHTSVREMMVVVFIKNGRFDEAKAALQKHFPRQMVGKKAILTALTKDKKKTHKVLEQMTYQQFRDEMLQFCESLYPPFVPYLQRAAKKLINDRHLDEDINPVEVQAAEQDSPAQSPLQSVPCPRHETRVEVEADSQEMMDSQEDETHITTEEPAQSLPASMKWSPVAQNAHISTRRHQRPQASNASHDDVQIPRSRLEAAYVTLAEGSEVSFDQLDEVESSSAGVEAPVIDKTSVTHDPTPEPTTTVVAAEPPGEADAPVEALFTVSRLVTLPDSNESTEEVETEGPETRAEVELENKEETRVEVEADSQEMMDSQEEETQVTTEEPAQSMAQNNLKSPVTHGGRTTSAQASNASQ